MRFSSKLLKRAYTMTGMFGGSPTPVETAFNKYGEDWEVWIQFSPMSKDWPNWTIRQTLKFPGELSPNQVEERVSGSLQDLKSLALEYFRSASSLTKVQLLERLGPDISFMDEDLVEAVYTNFKNPY